MYLCSLLAIQMYHPCFQSYLRKMRALSSLTERIEKGQKVSCNDHFNRYDILSLLTKALDSDK